MIVFGFSVVFGLAAVSLNRQPPGQSSGQSTTRGYVTATRNQLFFRVHPYVVYLYEKYSRFNTRFIDHLELGQAVGHSWHNNSF